MFKIFWSNFRPFSTKLDHFRRNLNSTKWFFRRNGFRQCGSFDEMALDEMVLDEVSRIQFRQDCNFYSGTRLDGGWASPMPAHFPVSTLNRATIGPPAKRHSNGVSPTGRWGHEVGCWLGSSCFQPMRGIFSVPNTYWDYNLMSGNCSPKN